MWESASFRPFDELLTLVVGRIGVSEFSSALCGLEGASERRDEGLTPFEFGDDRSRGNAQLRVRALERQYLDWRTSRLAPLLNGGRQWSNSESSRVSTVNQNPLGGCLHDFYSVKAEVLTGRTTFRWV